MINEVRVQAFSLPALSTNTYCSKSGVLIGCSVAGAVSTDDS
jgi:hypothetical protein